MASGISVQDREKVMFHFFETFQHMDKELIRSVLENCKFDVNKAGSMLVEMSSPSNNQQNERKDGNIQNDKSQMISFIKRGYKMMVIMRGLPGSGKSTLAMKILSDSLGKVNHDEFIFSTDHYFWKAGKYKYNVNELQDAHVWNQRRCFASMKRGVSPIIIDNTNTEIWEMKAYCVMAVKFGYMIEIAESRTPWALDIRLLSEKNSHGVDKQKIKDMRERYQKNVTLKTLFQGFSLKYEEKMPQLRKYPAIETQIENKKIPTTSLNSEAFAWAAPQRVYSSASKRVPSEYVHKFEMKYGVSVDGSPQNNFQQKYESLPPISSSNSDEFTSWRSAGSVDELLNMENKEINDSNKEYNTSKTDDLISFINEHKQPVQKEKTIKSTEIDHISKQLAENKEMMTKLINMISRKSPFTETLNSRNEEKITSSTAETKMEVDDGSDVESPRQNTPNFKTTGNEACKNLEDLEEENQKLWDLLSQTQNPDGTSTTRKKQLDVQTGYNFPTSKSTTPSISTALKQESTQIDMNFPDKSSPDDFEIIDMATSQKRQSSVPKFERKAWGLPEEALVSWEFPSPVSPYNPPQEDIVTSIIETREQATSTTLDDTLSNRGAILKRLNEKTIPITREKKITRKRATFDKSSMTDEEDFLLKINELDEAVRKLTELFPNIPTESIVDIYEKCAKDFYWTVDLLSNSPDYSIPVNKSQEKDTKKPSPDSSFKFDLNDWNITPSIEEEPSDIVEKRKLAEEFEKLRKRESVKLKKQLETSVNIGKEHYSDHVWQVKNVKMGLFPTPTEPINETSAEMMTVDDDTVYVSDDNTDSSSENDDYGDNIIEINLGTDLVNQLEGMFGALLSGNDFKPVVHMPESLARQLHALYLESICRQIENQSEHILSQLREDEEFATKLQEEERKSTVGNSMDEIMDEELAKSLYRKEIDQWRNLTPDTLALKLTKQKLYESFPNIPRKVLDELLVAHDNNYKETVETLISSTGDSQVNPASRDNLLQPPISDNTLTELKMQEQYFTKVIDENAEDVRPATYYRDEANQLMERRRELMNKAKEHHQKRNYEVALYYRNLAEKSLKKAEIANQHATQRIIEENSTKLRDGDTLDLHYLYVKSAIATLDVFVDYQISNLKSVNKPHQYCYVITGRGKRSENGKSILKPAVMKRLKKRNVHYSQVNPGMLKVKILQTLPTTSELGKPTN